MANNSEKELQEALDTKDVEIATEPVSLTPAEIRRLWLKIDLRVVPPLALIYLIQYMDKSNIGNAKIAGLQEQLNISSDQYTWVLSIFYFSYGLFEIPSNMILKNFNPAMWLCGLCVAFGLCLSLMGLCTNYSGLLAARFFLGVTTAGIYPGTVYIFTLWYPPSKYALRFSIFFCSATCAGFFSGLLSAAIVNMSGLLGHLGWSWIFIIMGCVGIAGGIFFYPFMPMHPERASFLSEKEQAYHRQSLEAEKVSHGSARKLRRAEVFAALKDWQTWSYTVLYFDTTVPLFSLAIFIPSIVAGLGYSGVQAQLMSVPPFICSVPFVILNAWLSDHYNRRAPFVLVSLSVGLIGWIVLRTAESNGARYAAAIIASIGHWSASPPINGAHAATLAPTGKRAVAIGVFMGVGNLCGIITSNVFRSDDAPRYLPGIHAMMYFAGSGIIHVAVLWYVYRSINKHRKELLDSGSVTQSQEELDEMGDKAPYV